MNSTKTTMTNAVDGIQANAEQSLTSTVVTSTFSTPTMTFGEVGKTAEQMTDSYAARMHGVGHFESNKLLERQVLIGTYQWNASSSGSLIEIDINQALKQNARNFEVLKQFRYYRPNQIEVTLRLNTNQFYVGSLMVCLYPGNIAANYMDELSVLDPMVISASCAESVVKTYSYAYPNAWLRVSEMDPVTLTVYVLNQLRLQGDNLPDAITVSLWARFKDIELSYPYSYQAEAQSSSMPMMRPKKRGSLHPAADPSAHTEGSPAKEMVSALTSIPVKMLDDALSPAAELISAGMGLLAILDKPDKTDPQTSNVIEGSTDLFCSDIADTNVNVGMYKDRYVDPSPQRLPMTGSWTISQYSQIPGIKAKYMFTPSATSHDVFLMANITGPDQPRTPLDYAYFCSKMWRGSIKLMIQFFASSFTSARFVLQYVRDPDGFEASYDNGLARVIDVKGDTTELITLPFLSDNWWNTFAKAKVRLKLASTIASTDPSSDPVIYANFWVAGGEDIQFAWPRIPEESEWPYREPPLQRKPDPASLKAKKKGPKAQSAVGKMFTQAFPPISENCVYDVDMGVCTNEQLGAITDICKRYSPLPTNNAYTGEFFKGEALDYWKAAPENTGLYANWVSFRNTFFGAWRAAFLFRSGGYRFRRIPLRDATHAWRVWEGSAALRKTGGTTYAEPFDGIVRITVPQLLSNPFGMLGQPQPEIHLDLERVDFGQEHLTYVAARDDIQLGYPILPSGIPPPYSP